MCLFHLRFSRDNIKFKKYPNDRKIIQFDRRLLTCPIDNKRMRLFLFFTLLKMDKFYREMGYDILKTKE